METPFPLLPFVKRIEESSVDSPHKGKVLMLRFCHTNQTVEQTIEVPVILDTMALLWRHSDIAKEGGTGV